jgi:ankyrin repeat protein
MTGVSGHHPQPNPQQVYVNGVPDRPIDDRLIEAIQAHNLARVKRLLAKGADPNANVANGYRPLMEVDTRDPSCIPIATVLLTAGSQINYRQPDQFLTALTSHTMDNLAYVKFLLAHGANPNLIGFSGQSPLEQAVGSGNPDIVRLLLVARADVSKQSISPPDENVLYPPNFILPRYDQKGETPIFGLCNKWSDSVYNLLLNAGADPNAKSKNGWSLLDTCLFKGNLAAENFLLAHGATTTELTKEGLSPLHLAVGSAIFPFNVELVRLLITRGVNLKLKDSNGNTAEDMLRSEIGGFLDRMRATKLDESGQMFLKSANQILKLIDPSAPPILNATFDPSKWMTLNGFDPPFKIRYRVIRTSSVSNLQIEVQSRDKAEALVFSNLYLDYYESNLPGPFVCKIPAGKPVETTIEFPPAAGQAGSLTCKITFGGGGGDVWSQDTPPIRLEPNVGWATTSYDNPIIGQADGPGYLFQNDSPDRTLEVVVDSMGSAYKGVLPLTFRLPPNRHKSIFDPSKIHLIKYRSRLLPNQRWIPETLDLGT